MVEPGERATSADQWAIEPTEILTLASGNKVEVRKPDMLSMITRGEIPNPLIGMVQQQYEQDELAELQELIERAQAAGRTSEEQIAHELDEGVLSGEDADRLRALWKETAESTTDSPDGPYGYIDLLVVATVIEPQMSLKPPVSRRAPHDEDGNISVKGLSDVDKMTIFRWGTSQLDGLATFRDNGAGADSVGDGGEVRAEAEHPVGAAEHAELGVGDSLS